LYNNQVYEQNSKDNYWKPKLKPTGNPKAAVSEDLCLLHSKDTVILFLIMLASDYSQ